MPLERCQKDGKEGVKYGPTGKCYTYTTEEGKKRAVEQAKKQGRAIEASKHRREN